MASSAGWCSRSRISLVPPAGTVRWYHQAALVPRLSGLTVAAPETTWSLMPSFGYGVSGGPPYRRAVFVSLSQNTARGGTPSGPVAASSRYPARRCPSTTTASPSRARTGTGWLAYHLHRVAEPQRGQHVDGRLVGAAVLHGDAREHLGRRDLRVGDLHRPEPVVLEHAGVEQLVLALLLAAAGVLVDELLVRVRGLRVVVAPPQPRVAGQAVHEPPVLLHVLAVVALGTGQAEHPLLEDRVDAVPQRQPEAQLVPDVGEPRHPVLVPAVRARAGVVVRERAPRVAVVAVVLAHRAPRALGEVRAPLVPGVGVEQVVLGPSRRLREPAVLGRVGLAVALHASSSTEAGPRGQPRSGRGGRGPLYAGPMRVVAVSETRA